MNKICLCCKMVKPLDEFEMYREYVGLCYRCSDTNKQFIKQFHIEQKKSFFEFLIEGLEDKA